MSEETKGIIQLCLEMLKTTLKENHVSMAVGKTDGQIYFFDTDTYMLTKKMDGFAVSVQDLVR